MIKYVMLSFASAETMSAFVLECNIQNVVTNDENFTLTGQFSDESIHTAIEQYKATIAKATDVILSEGEPIA